MDVNNNTYTFGFAAVMVVVVAALLSWAATSLKPAQDRNVEQEKMQNILSSIEINVSREEAAEIYSDYVVEELVIQNDELKEGVEAFNIDLAKEINKPVSERQAPMYVAEKEGSRFFVIPVRGTGLWGPIWGYVALESDLATVYGATFDHKAETPGLGAEINTPSFEGQFKGKRIMNDEFFFVGIDVRKGDASNDFQVDGISGGTITSDGVEAMIMDNMKAYIPFLKKYTGLNAQAAVSLN